MPSMNQHVCKTLVAYLVSVVFRMLLATSEYTGGLPPLYTNKHGVPYSECK